jgi:hypothetical protein
MTTIENHRRFAGILRLILVSVVAAIVWAITGNAMALTLNPGDIVIATQIGPSANNDHGLVVVDPATGSRTILSDNGTGTGPDFTSPAGIAIEPDGDLLATDLGGPAGHASIFRVDPLTGDRTIVSTFGVGTGPNLSTPYDLVEVGGTIFVTNGPSANVLAVDPTTGNRTLFSGQLAGTGKQFFDPIGVTIQGHNLVVADNSNLVYQVDLSTGNRVNFYQFANNQNTPENPVGVAISNGGQILLSSEFGGGASTVPGVFLFDPQTATYSLVSGGSVGTGPTISDTGPTGIATEPNGTILLNEATLNAVISIDPITGNRTILSDATHGLGPTITGPLGVLVIPSVPEPSAIVLAALGGLALPVWRWRVIDRRGCQSISFQR